MQLTRTESNPRLRRELSRDAIALALKGDWQRAADVNRAILELFPGDVDAMNRLGKALLELGHYREAESTFSRAIGVSPYNRIAKKNLARLSQLESAPVPSKLGSKLGGIPQLFIEESGKSASTVLQKPASSQVVARIAPGNPVILVLGKNSITVKTREDEYLGLIEPKLAARLSRLMNGGNQYEAAILSVSHQTISVIIRETFRHPSLHDVCSFPSRSRQEHHLYLGHNLMRYIEEDELEDEDEKETDLGDEELDSEWKD